MLFSQLCSPDGVIKWGGGGGSRVRGGIGEWGQHLHTYMRTVMGTAVVLVKPWCAPGALLGKPCPVEHC
jgi:hypothetical protein